VAEIALHENRPFRFHLDILADDEVRRHGKRDELVAGDTVAAEVAPPELTLELARYALDHMGEEHALVESLCEWAGGDEPPLTSESKRALGAQSAARMFARTRAARDYHLAFSACALRQHAARLVE